MGKEKINMDLKTAKQISKILLDCANSLDSTVSIVKENCDSETFESYRDEVASIVASIGWDVMEKKIFKQYPELRPYKLESSSNDKS